MFSATLMDVFQDSDADFPVSEVPFDKIPESKRTRAMNQVSHSCEYYNFTISTKTEVVHQLVPGQPHHKL